MRPGHVLSADLRRISQISKLSSQTPKSPTSSTSQFSTTQTIRSQTNTKKTSKNNKKIKPLYNAKKRPTVKKTNNKFSNTPTRGRWKPTSQQNPPPPLKKQQHKKNYYTTQTAPQLTLKNPLNCGTGDNNPLQNPQTTNKQQPQYD
jgi:hypothetical protein